jgi:hypothetical protein
MCLLRTSEVRALRLVLLGLVVVDASDDPLVNRDRYPCGQGEAVVRKGLSLRKAGSVAFHPDHAKTGAFWTDDSVWLRLSNL